MSQPKYSPKDIKRFWSKVGITDNPDECWLWMRGLTTGGYGAFYANGKNHIASVTAWEIINGEKPPKMVVCHKCDNPRCCNPSHLFIGTQSDNMLDRERKGRHRPVSVIWAEKRSRQFFVGRKVKVKYRFFPDEMTWVNRSHYDAIGVIDVIKLNSHYEFKPYHVVFDFDEKGGWFEANDLDPLG